MAIPVLREIVTNDLVVNTTPGSTDPTLKVDGGGRTNVWSLQFDNVGEGTSGMTMNFASGGWMSMGVLFGAPAQLSATNRTMKFNLAGDAYDPGTPFSFQFVAQQGITRTVMSIQSVEAGRTGDFFQTLTSAGAVNYRIDKDGAAHMAAGSTLGGLAISTGGLVPWTAASVTANNGVYSLEQTVSAVGVVPSSVIDIRLAPGVPADENEPEGLSLYCLNAVAGTGNFVVTIVSQWPLNGIIKLLYKVSS